MSFPRADAMATSSSRRLSETPHMIWMSQLPWFVFKGSVLRRFSRIQWVSESFITILGCHFTSPTPHTHSPIHTRLRELLAASDLPLTDCGIQQITPTTWQNTRKICIQSFQLLLTFSKTFPPWQLFTKYHKAGAFQCVPFRNFIIFWRIFF
jgi:hypothetical protein